MPTETPDQHRRLATLGRGFLKAIVFSRPASVAVAQEEFEEALNVSEHGFIDDDATLDEEWLRQAFPSLERVTPHGPDYLAFEIGKSRCEYCFGDDYNPPRLWVGSNTINDPRRWHVRQLAAVFGVTLGTAAAP